MWIVGINQFLLCDRYFHHLYIQTSESWWKISQAQNKYFLLIAKMGGKRISHMFSVPKGTVIRVVNFKTCTCHWVLPNCVCSSGCLQYPCWHTFPKARLLGRAGMITIACVWQCCSSSLWQSGCTKAVLCLRSLTDAAGASPSKYSRQYVRIPVESGQAVSLPRDRGRGLDRMIHTDSSLSYSYQYPNLVIKCSPFCNGQL